MKSYQLLSRSTLLKRYSYKFLFVAFLGIHIPLIGLIVYLLFSSGSSSISIVLVTLGFTLVATIITLTILNKLLAPIIEGKKALLEYVENDKLPQLPTSYTDEIGLMLKYIQHTIEKLHSLIEEKNDIISLISHDLRSPVDQILGLLDILKVETDEKKRKEYCQHLEVAANNQKIFLTNMIDLLKSKDLQINSTHFEETDIASLLDEVINLNRKNLESKNLTLSNQLPNNLSAILHKDAFKVVLNNIISNAIKFSYEKSSITVTGESRENKLLISIQDNGKGFDDTLKDKMFVKFNKGKTGTNNEPSTGLGLYLSQKIIKIHNGLIVAKSKGDNKGAVFTIKLPKNTTNQHYN